MSAEFPGGGGLGSRVIFGRQSIACTCRKEVMLVLKRRSFGGKKIIQDINTTDSVLMGIGYHPSAVYP